jgi:tetratricopeptide (TPR) repeat protein
MKAVAGAKIALCLGLLAAALVAGSGTVRAQKSGDDEAGEADKRRRAGEHVQKGDRFKESGDYDRAAREYERAYKLVPHPVLFFNLAQVYRLGGKKEKALEYYRKYLDRDPRGRAADQAREFARQLEKELKKKRSGGGDGEPDRGGGSGTGSGGGSGGGSDGAGTGDRDSGMGSWSRARWMKVGGMAAGGVGAVSLGVGVVFGLKARSISNELSAFDGEWTDEELAKQTQGKKYESRMLIWSGLGAAAIAGGAVLYYLGYKEGRAEASVVATPVADGEAVGFALGGRF